MSYIVTLLQFESAKPRISFNNSVYMHIIIIIFHAHIRTYVSCIIQNRNEIETIQEPSIDHDHVDKPLHTDNIDEDEVGIARC